MADLKIGIIVSTDGSAFRSVFEILDKTNLEVTFFVALDRKTSLVDYCISRRISFEVFDGLDNDEFSNKVVCYFKKCEVDFSLLFFSRLVTEDLFLAIQCINLHPSLLPKFPGMNAIANFCESDEDFFGLTAHLVDSGIDTGPKLLQVSLNYKGPRNVDSLQPVSYFQKVLASLLIIDSKLNSNEVIPMHDGMLFLNQVLENSFRSYFDANTLRNYLFNTIVARYAFGHE